jgi:hypothetical protein
LPSNDVHFCTSLVQHDTEKSRVNLQPAVVLDESEQERSRESLFARVEELIDEIVAENGECRARGRQAILI